MCNGPSMEGNQHGTLQAIMGSRVASGLKALSDLVPCQLSVTAGAKWCLCASITFTSRDGS